MVYVGVDQHKRFSQVVALDEDGQTLAGTRLDHADKEAMRRWLSQWGPDSCAVLEAGGSWYWLYDLLEECVGQVKMAHPASVRLIADSKVKTDKIDASVLAQLERLGFLPESYVPPRRVRDEREVHRLRIFLVRLSTALKNRIHGALSKLGIECPHSDLFGQAGRRFLEALELRPPYAEEVRCCLEVLDLLQEKVKETVKEIRRSLRADPRAQLLMSVPGIGELFGYLVLCEVGEMERFSSEKKFAAYCALTPSTHQSGSRLWHGHTGRRGNLYLKWAFTEAAHVAVQHDPALKAYYEELKRRKGAGTAALAVARKLATAVHFVLKRNEPYRYNYLTKRHLGKPRVVLGRS